MLQDRLGKLDGLVLVQGSPVKQSGKVLQNGGDLTGLRGDVLQLVDGVLGSQLLGRGSDLRGTGIVALVQEVLELLVEQVLSTREATARGKRQGQRDIGQFLQDIRDDLVLGNLHSKNLAQFIDGDDTSTVLVRSSGEHRLGGDSVHKQVGTRLDIIQVDETVLGQDVDDTILVGGLQADREVVGSIGREENVDDFLGEWRVAVNMVDLNHVQTTLAQSSLVSNTEDLGRVRGTTQLDLSKLTNVARNGLGHAPGLAEKLGVARNAAVFLGNTGHCKPI